MQTIQVGEFKARFSEMIDSVRAGETIIVAYGRNQEKVAALIPYDQLPDNQPRQLGVLADKTGIETVYRLCAFLPAIGLLAAFLPKIDKHPPLAPTPPGLEPEAV